MPNAFSPSGQPAENSKWKQPLTIYPTSPGRMQLKLESGAGSLVVACIYVGYTKEARATNHKASPRLSWDISLRQVSHKSGWGRHWGLLVVYPPGGPFGGHERE